MVAAYSTIRWLIHGSKITVDATIATIFGTNERDCSWIWVMRLKEGNDDADDKADDEHRRATMSASNRV